MRKRRLLTVVLLLGGLLFIGVSSLTLGWWPASGSAIITVNSGDSLSAVGNELASAGVVPFSLVFRFDALVFGAPLVRPGAYEIPRGASYAEIRGVLAGGPNVFVVHVYPGLTIREVEAQIVTDRGTSFGDNFAQSLARDAASIPGIGTSNPEGLIGAGDYVLAPSEGPASLARAMVHRFEVLMQSVGLTPSTHIAGLSLYEEVTAASIVEKEGYYPHNMPQVARVILNRLARHGSLQMDSTVLYYLGQDGGTVTPSMLRLRTPYNTYLHAGLTPTPICVVSADALRALLHAPAGSWYYFVVVDKAGDEAFATTFAQQLVNEELARSRGVA